jgi:apolipoprotein N-acyltransferase
VKSKIAAIIAVLLFLFMTLFGAVRLACNSTKFTEKKVRIIQADIPQESKNDRNSSFLNLKKHLRLSRHDSRIDIVIWPEASVPYLYKENFTQLHDYLKSCLCDGEYLLAGAVREDSCSGKIYNSIVVTDHTGKNVATFDKRRLLPFGEYVPF